MMGRGGWEGGGEMCVTGGRRREALLGVAGLQEGVTRTPHPSHEQGTLVLPHCDTDNTLFVPGLQPSGRGDFIIQTAAGLRGGGGGSGVGWGIRGSWWVLLSTVSHKRCKRQHFHCEAKLMLISWSSQELILSAHKFITTREPGEQSVFLFICRATDSNYCHWENRDLDTWSAQ